MKISIIGAGIAGLSAARVLSEAGHEVMVLESNRTLGGLVHCERANGNLYHKIGGHVFNSKDTRVLSWFWKFFNKDQEFVKANRKAKIFLGGDFIDYPIENNLSQLEGKVVKNIVKEIIELSKKNSKSPFEYPNFKEFLKGNFGDTLNELYFKPYNEKIWQHPLDKVDMAWLDGKLPMPNYVDMLVNSISRKKESEMVHSTFYYPKYNGSQFIVDRLAEGLNVISNYKVKSLNWINNSWSINNDIICDGIIYTSDVRVLGNILTGIPEFKSKYFSPLQSLKIHGTSNILCEALDDIGDISWLYIPDPNIKAHRIIFTGNFSDTNNRSSENKSCVVEFSGKYDYELMKKELKKLPFRLKPIKNNYAQDTYVIQDVNTRENINRVQEYLNPFKFWLHGRFAEWEYYNMDKVIQSSLNKFSDI